MSFPPTPPIDPHAFEPVAPALPAEWTWAPARPRPSLWKQYGRHALLFVLTAVSVFLCQGLRVAESMDGTWLWQWDVSAGLRLMSSVMSILLAHEMGHYLACRRYGVEATLPFFLPVPFISLLGDTFPLVGTFGAVIRIKSPFPHRRALFDIGIAGPLAGFAVCLPVLVLGLLEAHVAPHATHAFGQEFGEPLLFRWMARWLLGPLPPDSILLIGPFGMAAWWGLLMTALNLIPIGQLDGGHVTYALFGERAEQLSRLVWWLCVGLIVLVGPSFILWTLLVRLLGLRHPRTLDDGAPLGPGRAWLALVGLGVFALCFLPDPFRLTWSDIFAAWKTS